MKVNEPERQTLEQQGLRQWEKLSRLAFGPVPGLKSGNFDDSGPERRFISASAVPLVGIPPLALSLTSRQTCSNHRFNNGDRCNTCNRQRNAEKNARSLTAV